MTGLELKGVTIDPEARIRTLPHVPGADLVGPQGARQAESLVDGAGTVITHFSTCPHPTFWSKRGK